MLARDTDFRQGDILTRDTATMLGLIEAIDDGRRAIIITHDCDLAHEGEAFVEIMVGEPVLDGPDPQLSYAKNPRRLHLTYETANAVPLIFDLRHSGRHNVPKDKFAKHAARESNTSLCLDAKRSLKQWLAARYGRPAFPNAFEARLRKRTAKRTVEQRIAKILEPNAKYLVGLFFDLGEQRGVEAAEGEPYGLSLLAVYDAIEGGTQARRSAEQVVTQLRQLFDDVYGRPELATEIALDACEAVADTSITLSDLRRIDQWRLEYISLRGDEQGNFLAVGELPG